MSRFVFNTIALFTTNNQKVVDFYCNIFGFETNWNGIDLDVEMHLGGMRILLFPRESIEKMTSQKFTYPSGINGTMEISFDVPTFADVDKEYQRAVGMGATSIMGPTTEPWGATYLLYSRPRRESGRDKLICGIDPTYNDY